jgi:hypothetical protein
VPRIDHRTLSTEEPENYVGPGYYDQPSKLEVGLKKIKLAQSQKLLPRNGGSGPKKPKEFFMTKAPRFSAKKERTPGPCQYDPPKKPWFKPSSNQQFLES